MKSDVCVDESRVKRWKTQPELFARVRWHGPVRSVPEWVEYAGELEKSDHGEFFRLYAACGRAKRYSLRKSELQYIGMNARDSRMGLSKRIERSAKDRIYRGFFNEYWIGEIADTLDLVDTADNGVSRWIERALIASLDPNQNANSHKSLPSYSFFILNEFPANDRFTGHLGRRPRLKKLIPQFIEYSQRDNLVTFGHLQRRVARKLRPADVKSRRSGKEKVHAVRDTLSQRWEPDLDQPHPIDAGPHPG